MNEEIKHKCYGLLLGYKGQREADLERIKKNPRLETLETSAKRDIIDINQVLKDLES